MSALPATLTGFLTEHFGDRVFHRQLLRIAAPVALNNLSFNALNMVSVLMVGQLGDAPVAAVGLANQINFLLNLVLFGITSGAAIFTAQLWGRRDLLNIHKVLGLTLVLCLVTGLSFMLASLTIPEKLLGIYTADQQVSQLGGQYLRIYAWVFALVPITSSYAIILRSVGQVNLPTLVSTSALGFNALLSYLLIFGKLGLPEMGVLGAAWASLLARVLECVILLFVTYRRRLPAAASLSELFGFDLAFARRVLRPVLPVALNEALWSFGITTYNVIYARIGTEAIAAMNIVATLDGMALVPFVGIANACAVLAGNLIGAGDEAQAQRYAQWSLNLSFAGAWVMALLLLLISPLVLSWYQVSPDVIHNARMLVIMIAAFYWVRMSNLQLFIGTLRSGGDTRFAMILDGVIIWVVGVPLAAAGAFLLHLPVQYVYLMAMSEEVTKMVLGYWRFRSKRWIHNLAKTVSN